MPRVMTNPLQLMLAGNPRTPSKKAPGKKAMARRKKSRKSPAVRAKRAIKRRARRASRKGKMPAGLKAYWAKKRGKSSAVAAPKRKRRSSRKAKMKVKRARRTRARRRIHKKGTPHVQGSHEWNAGRVVKANPRRRKSHMRKARKSRRTKRNAGAATSMTLMGGLKGFIGNAKDTFMGGGVKGFIAAAAGAGGAVLAGTVVDRLTRPTLAMVVPQSLMSNPIFNRVLGAANYYVSGWALAKYLPGINSRTRRAMLTGATAAALIEALKPGAVRQVASGLPVVGGLFGYALEGCADGVSDYVAYALNGADSSGGSTNAGGAAQEYYLNEGDDGMADYSTLSEYSTAESQY